MVRIDSKWKPLYSTAPFPLTPEHSKRVTLIFHLREFPVLSKLEYSSSRLLSPNQIEKILEERKLTPQLGKPADPAALQRIAFAIRNRTQRAGPPGRRRSNHASGIGQRHRARSFRYQRWSLTASPTSNLRGPPSILHKALARPDAQYRAVEALASWRGKMPSLAMHLNLTVSESLPITRTTAFRKHESALHKWPFPRKPRFDGFLGRTNLPPRVSPSRSPSKRDPLYHFKSIAATHALQQPRKGEPHYLALFWAGLGTPLFPG